MFMLERISNEHIAPWWGQTYKVAGWYDLFGGKKHWSGITLDVKIIGEDDDECVCKVSVGNPFHEEMNGIHLFPKEKLEEIIENKKQEYEILLVRKYSKEDLHTYGEYVYRYVGPNVKHKAINLALSGYECGDEMMVFTRPTMIVHSNRDYFEDDTFRSYKEDMPNDYAENVVGCGYTQVDLSTYIHDLNDYHAGDEVVIRYFVPELFRKYGYFSYRSATVLSICGEVAVIKIHETRLGNDVVEVVQRDMVNKGHENLPC